MIERALAWFGGRSLREKRLLVVAAALALLTIVWGGIIRPVGDALSSARERHGDAVIRLAETEARLRAVERLQRDPPGALAGPLDATIRDSANQAGFPLASVQPQGQDRVDITIGAARPGALFGWIAGLERSGLLVDSLAITDNGDRTVSTRMTLRARGR